MSFNTVLSFDDNYRKMSFSQRVCDDLSEVILQFLPLKDKLRFECVSKQFQRTIFQRHYELVIDNILEETKNRTNHLKTVLQKLPNITSLRQKDFLKYSNHFLEDSDIDLIIKNCNHLNEMDCDLSNMSDKMRDKFVEKFGSKLDSFSAKPTDIEMIGKSFSNIKELKCLIYDWSYSTSEQLFGLSLRHLKKLWFRFDEPKDESFDKHSKCFEKFIENNRHLTHLRITLFVVNETTFEFIFKQISHLNDLIELQIYANPRIADNIVDKLLRQLSVNCPKLKSLGLYIRIKKTETFHVFKDFKNLKRLDIRFSLHYYLSSENSLLLYHRLNKSLKGLENLTHLTLKFVFFPPLTDVLIQDIDIYLPNLKILNILYPFDATEQTADILSSLSKLEAIETQMICRNSDVICSQIESRILKNCPKIKLIRLDKTD